MIGHIFSIIFFQPLLNLLVFGYHFIPDVGVVIVLTTVIIRLLLAPTMHSSLKSQGQMTALQPKMNEIREKFKNDKEAQAKAMMNLYKEHSINPLSSCLPVLIQLPFLIALYEVFIRILRAGDITKDLYPFIHNPGTFNPLFLHLLNLAQPSFVLGLVAGAAQYLQSRMLMPKEGSSDPTQKALQVQTLYIFPALTVFISLRLPAGLPLYWIVTTLFGVAQQYYIMKKSKVDVSK